MLAAHVVYGYTTDLATRRFRRNLGAWAEIGT
jgi:hypothetical protein